MDLQAMNLRGNDEDLHFRVSLAAVEKSDAIECSRAVLVYE